MADPIFTTNEALRLIALPKLALVEELQDLIGGRDTQGEDSYRINVSPGNASAPVRFFLDVKRCDEIEMFSLSLIASPTGVSKEIICRYDLHDTLHPNPDGRPPPLIGAGVPHRHVYNADDVHMYGRWDKYGEILNLAGPTDFASRRRRLFWTAMQAMGVGMHDHETRQRILALVQT